jgi:hypothetical protein
MYKFREGRGYPANFPSLLAHFKCETCAVTLGARTYRTSKRVQDKGYHTKRQQESEVILTSTSTCLPLKCACCAPSEGGLPDTSRQATCLARASQSKKKRRKSKKGLSLPLQLNCCSAAVEGPFADDRTSVLPPSNCRVCETWREGRGGGAVDSVGVLRARRCHLRAGFQQCKSFVEMGTVRCCPL